MPNKNYERGRAAEYKAIQELRDEGYYAVRTAGSHSCVDIVAWNDAIVRLIQIKTYKDVEGDYGKDTTCLQEMSIPPFTRCEIWTRKTGKTGWTRREVISSTFKLVSPSGPSP